MKTNSSRIFQVVVGLLAAVAPALAGTAITPEPTTIALVGGGLGALILIERRRRARK